MAGMYSAYPMGNFTGSCSILSRSVNAATHGNIASEWDAQYCQQAPCACLCFVPAAGESSE